MGRSRELIDLIVETPDSVGGTGKDRRPSWADKDAIAFGYIGDRLVVSRNGNHPQITQHLRYATAGSRDEYVQELDGTSVETDTPVKESAAFYDEVMAWLAKRDQNHDRSREAMAPSGRIWTNQEVASFWQKASDIPPEKVTRLFEFLKQDPYAYKFEFIGDKRGAVHSFDYLLSGGVESEGELSDEEIAELVAQQHLDPEAKKKLQAAGVTSPDFGSRLSGKQATQRGFRSVAAQRAADVIGDSVAKEGN